MPSGTIQWFDTGSGLGRIVASGRSDSDGAVTSQVRAGLRRKGVAH
jgi:hypothetical protein